MSKLRLDYLKDTTFPWLGTGLAGVVLILLTLIAMYFLKLRSDVDLVKLKIEQTVSKKSGDEVIGPTTEKGRQEQTQEIKNANEILHHLSVPWTELFKAVEASSTSDITLLSLQPDFEKKQVKISGEGKDYSTVMEYITELQGQKVLDSVFLQNHDIKQDDPDKPVRFTLVANWREVL